MRSRGLEPVARRVEIGLVIFAAPGHGLREQVAVAQPGHRALQGGAIIVQRNRSVLSFRTLHDVDPEAFEGQVCFESMDVS